MNTFQKTYEIDDAGLDIYGTSYSLGSVSVTVSYEFDATTPVLVSVDEIIITSHDYEPGMTSTMLIIDAKRLPKRQYDSLHDTMETLLADDDATDPLLHSHYSEDDPRDEAPE